MAKTHTSLLVTALALAALLLAAPVALAQAPGGDDDGPSEEEIQKLSAQADALFAQLDARTSLARAWNDIFALDGIQRRAETAVAARRDAGLKSTKPILKLASATLTAAAGKVDSALEACQDLLETSKDAGVLEAVAQLAGRLVVDLEEEDWQDLVELFSERQAKVPVVAGVAFAREMLGLALDDDQEAAAKKLLIAALKAKDTDARAEAVLALAENGEYARVARAVERLAWTSGARGQLARAIVENEKLRQDIRAVSGQSAPAQRPFFEVLARRVHERAAVLPKETGNKDRGDYRVIPPEEQLRAATLLDNACRGMVGGLDPFSVYMTGADMTSMVADMEGNYGGIGAYVQKFPGEDFVTITQPIYSGPAYKAGLRSGDKLYGVEADDGSVTSFKGWPLEDVVKALKGTPDTDVKVRIMRRGWKEPRTFPLRRGMIHINTAKAALLPGQLGYIRLTRFGYNSAADVEQALTKLEGQKMKGLVLDLRGNPGGALRTVIDIASKFLPRRELVAYSQGIWGEWRQRTNYRTRGANVRTMPMVVLIDGDSASGSEMLSGSLKDHKRATIIGETSFGKGVGQAFFFLTSTQDNDPPKDDPAYQGFRRWLRVTTFEYFLPHGQPVNHKGVSPDIKMSKGLKFQGVHYTAEFTDWASWQRAEINRLLEQDPIEKYLNEHFEERQATLKKLAEFDDFSTAKYPEFDAWYASLKTTLSKDDCRRLLRSGVTTLRDDGLRRRAADVRGREFAHNLQEDAVLQRGVAELAKKLGLDLAKFPRYRRFAKKWR